MKKVTISKVDYEQKRRDRERLLKLKELHKKQGKILAQIKKVAQK